MPQLWPSGLRRCSGLHLREEIPVIGTECDFIIWKERMGRYIDRELAIELARGREIAPWVP